MPRHFFRVTTVRPCSARHSCCPLKFLSSWSTILAHSVCFCSCENIGNRGCVSQFEQFVHDGRTDGRIRQIFWPTLLASKEWRRILYPHSYPGPKSLEYRNLSENSNMRLTGPVPRMWNAVEIVYYSHLSLFFTPFVFSFFFPNFGLHLQK